MADEDDEESVGYGRPPRKNRFEPGKSGNPRGRPKGSRNAATILEEISRAQVKVMDNGRTRVMSKYEAAMTQLVNKAATGDLKAIRELHSWRKSFAAAESLMPPPESDEKHKEGIAILLKRLGRQNESKDDNTQPEPPKENG